MSTECPPLFLRPVDEVRHLMAYPDAKSLELFVIEECREEQDRQKAQAEEGIQHLTHLWWFQHWQNLSI